MNRYTIRRRLASSDMNSLVTPKKTGREEWAGQEGSVEKGMKR